MILNIIFVALPVVFILGVFFLFRVYYVAMLRWCLLHKWVPLTLSAGIVIVGLTIWLGFGALFGWLPASIRSYEPVSTVEHMFPGLGKEFMPPLDEGSFLYMPTTMPHASIGEAAGILKIQNMALHNIPEIVSVVGKAGRADTPLDPAPVSMIETIINYHNKYLTDENGHHLTFRCNPDSIDWARDREGEKLIAPDGIPYRVRGAFIRNTDGDLIPDKHGMPFRLVAPRTRSGPESGPQVLGRNPDP